MSAIPRNKYRLFSSILESKNSVVLKTEYVLLQTTLLEFEQRLKDERALRIVTEKERDVAEAKIIEENVSSSIKESSNADVKSNKFNRISTSILTEANVSKINSLIADIINMTTIEKNNSLIEILVRENVIRVTSESPNKSYASYGFTDYGIGLLVIEMIPTQIPNSQIKGFCSDGGLTAQMPLTVIILLLCSSSALIKVIADYSYLGKTSVNIKASLR
ncbi:MAG: hypothetical protein EOO43_01635 [Flavobacterium sp.]|nr:MAG: hypothetical protein EOO43_01635 [Flavobacterium sp.]